MNKNILFILVVLFAIYLLIDTKENFSQIQNNKDQWNEMAKYQCKNLEKKLADLDLLIQKCNNKSDVLAENNQLQTDINNGFECIDDNNRYISNEIDKRMWCNEEIQENNMGSSINDGGILQKLLPDEIDINDKLHSIDF